MKAKLILQIVLQPFVLLVLLISPIACGAPLVPTNKPSLTPRLPPANTPLPASVMEELEITVMEEAANGCACNVMGREGCSSVVVEDDSVSFDCPVSAGHWVRARIQRFATPAEAKAALDAARGDIPIEFFHDYPSAYESHKEQDGFTVDNHHWQADRWLVSVSSTNDTYYTYARSTSEMLYRSAKAHALFPRTSYVPPVSSVAPIEPYWQNASMVPFALIATASDSVGGMERVELYYRHSVDGIVWGDWKLHADSRGPSYTWSFSRPEGDGHYEFYTIAKDQEGNVEMPPESADARVGVDTIRFSEPDIVWEVISNDDDTRDRAEDIAMDAAGNIYVTGWSMNGETSDFRTMKYDADGNEIWNVIYDGGGNERAEGIAVDSAGNVYVTGGSGRVPGGIGGLLCTVKYDADGHLVWHSTYGYGDSSEGRGIAVDAAGNVYVTGFADGGESLQDYHTIKYDPDGNAIWNVTSGSQYSDFAEGIAVDAAGNVYITGSNFLTTKKYDAAGRELWSVKNNARDSNDSGTSIAVDEAGYIYVAGSSQGNFRTIKYDAKGNEIWDVLYDGGGDERAWGIALDSAGNVYVTGRVWITPPSRATQFAALTVKYDSDGSVIWKTVYHDYEAHGVAVGPTGDVYITGYSYNESNNDFHTIRYTAVPLALLSPEDGAAISTNTPTLAWQTISDAGSGLDHYEVWLDGAKVADVPAETTSHTTSVLDSGDHSWYVVGVDVAGNERRSDSVFGFVIEKD